MSRLLITGLAVTLTGCVLGGRPATWPPAHTAAGLDVTLYAEVPFLAGELLAVEDSALLIAVRWPNPDSSAATPRLARVAIRHIRAVDGAVPLRVKWGPAETRRFRALARYPQGVDAALEAKLIAAYQTDAVHWKAPR